MFSSSRHRGRFSSSATLLARGAYGVTCFVAFAIGCAVFVGMLVSHNDTIALCSASLLRNSRVSASLNENAWAPGVGDGGTSGRVEACNGKRCPGLNILDAGSARRLADAAWANGLLGKVGAAAFDNTPLLVSRMLLDAEGCNRATRTAITGSGPAYTALAATTDAAYALGEERTLRCLLGDTICSGRVCGGEGCIGGGDVAGFGGAGAACAGATDTTTASVALGARAGSTLTAGGRTIESSSISSLTKAWTSLRTRCVEGDDGKEARAGTEPLFALFLADEDEDDELDDE